MAITSGIAAVVGVVVGGAQAGYSAKRGHDQKVQATHEVNDEKARQLAIQQELDAKESANEERKRMATAYNQQRALAAGRQGRAGSIRTSPFGVQAPKVGGNDMLGAA